MIKDILKRFCAKKQPNMFKKFRTFDHYKMVVGNSTSGENQYINSQLSKTQDVRNSQSNTAVEWVAPDLSVYESAKNKIKKSSGTTQTENKHPPNVRDQINLPPSVGKAAADDNQEQKDGKLRNPTCAKCRNHRKTTPLKFHKSHCPYRKCACKKCKLTDKRREVMAKQVYLRRSQEQEQKIKELKEKGLISDEQFAKMQNEISEETPPQSSQASPHSAFAHTQAAGISPSDLCLLQQSLYKIIDHFKSYQQSPTFIHTLYLTILRDNNFDHQAVIQKISEGDNEYRKLGLSLQVLKTVTPPSPTNQYWPNMAAAAAGSSSPSTSSPFLASFHPHCYPSLYPSNYPFSYSQSSAAIMSSIPTHGSHPSIEAAAAAAAAASPYNLYFHPAAPYTTTTPPSSATSNSIIPDVMTRVYTPPNRHPVDGHTSGDSRGSPEYKEESDKEAPSGGGNGAPLPPTTVGDSSSVTYIHRRTRAYRPYPVPWQDRVETAANA